MSKVTGSIEDSDISLDEILLSIRSVVMDDESKSQNDGLTLTTAGVKRSVKVNDKKEEASVSISPKKTNNEAATVTVNNEAATITANNEAATVTVNNEAATVTVNNEAATVTVNKPSANLPAKSYLLTQIVDMGVAPIEKPIVNDMTQHQVEQSIIDLVEILSASKDELPDTFYEKQDEIIKVWLDQYLPSIVESQVRKEIRRIGSSIMQNQ